MTRIGCIGECMIELREEAGGRLSRGYGGDTLNTALYMARLGASVDYATALGDDPWSDEMIASWQAEGIGTDLVVRVPGRLPGLYVVQTDASGERRFSYWRDSAAARLLFELPETSAICDPLAGYDLPYCSGITLSLYGETGRQRLFETLDRARQKGCRVAFDTNFRPRGWSDRGTAQDAYRSAFERADIVLASVEDLDLLFGREGEGKVFGLSASAEIILKLPDLACRVVSRDIDLVVRADPVARVVDTTAAGDSFAAAYLASRLAGADPAIAAAAGHRLAGIVVGYPGAIIPREGMPATTTSKALPLKENDP
ncbi:MAG: sugar kinase [Microvirga sp.]